MNYADIPSKRIESHANTCASAVLKILGKTLLEKQPTDKALMLFLKANHQFGARDRRIINETLYSVLRWWGWLYHLAPQSFTEALQKDTRQEPAFHLEEWYALLAAAWLLEGRPELPPSAQWWLYQSQVPVQEIPVLAPNASILERRHSLRPFFNGEMPALPLEELLPQWCYSEIDSSISSKQLIQWMQTRPPVWLRMQVNDFDRIRAELARDEVKLVQDPHIKHAFKASFSGVNLRQLPAFLSGRFEVQDLASQIISLTCAPQPGENWWDCCAGAGGKTLHLAFQMHGKGKIMATDNRTYKLEELKSRAARCGFSNITCKEWLGIDVPRYANLFKGVLVDAPCSCSGVWRRALWSRWQTCPSDLNEITQLQSRLLHNASNGVAPRGKLIYATCSMFKRENEDIVSQYLTSHPNFSLLPFASPLDGTQTPGMLQIWPWDGDCDAMFVAQFQKNS